MPDGNLNVTALTVLRRHRQRLASVVLSFYAVGLMALACQPCAMAMDGGTQPGAMSAQPMPADFGASADCPHCPPGAETPPDCDEASTPCGDVSQPSSDARLPKSASSAPFIAASLGSSLDASPPARPHALARAACLHPARPIVLTFGVFLK